MAVIILVAAPVFVIPFSIAAITVVENCGSALTWREAIAGGQESLEARIASGDGSSPLPSSTPAVGPRSTASPEG
jgi:hypothetical protein